jgi:arylesterase/paraoxonase
MGYVKRIAIGVAVVLVVGVCALVLRMLTVSGLFVTVTPGFAGTCKTLTGIVGAEDIAVDDKDRLVFLSSTDWRHVMTRPSARDGIYTMALDHPEAGFTRLAGVPSDFHPHGISLYRGPDGGLTLMAINHPTPGHSEVTIFDVVVANGAAKLTEVGSIQGDLLVSVNDIAAVGRDRFYATNDHGSHTRFGLWLESTLMLPRGNVIYFDGAVLRVAAQNLSFANGIALSKDANHLYVAESTGRMLHSYARDPFSGALTEDKTLSLPAVPDNIDVDEAGALWVGAHPKLFALIAYGGDPAKLSPSQVFKVDPGLDHATLVYSNDGRQIGASSVGAAVDRQLFIGSIYDAKILDCTFN